MATKLPISQEGHDALVLSIKNMVDHQKNFTQFYDKLEIMDRAYASYVSEQDKLDAEDLDTPIETPLIVSQVDTVVAYLAEIYLSGYPTFGIVADGEARKVGDQMEALIDSFATKGSWGQHMLRSFVDGAKYNINALESTWEPRRILSVQSSEVPSVETPEVGFTLEYINKIICPDMYNTFWDYNLNPVDIATRGDYVGYNEIYSRLELKRLTLQLGEQGIGMNTTKAFESSLKDMETYYRERPAISDYNLDRSSNSGDWEEFALGLPPGAKSKIDYSTSYLVTKVYVRLIPKEYSIITPKYSEPQIWKFWVVNLTTIIGMERVYTPDDALPIRFGQYNDDGYAYQTRSVAEGILPWQDVASELINIRLNAARRAISDRAIYDTKFISENDVNTRYPAAKIPMKKSLRGTEKSIDQIYRAIPFESQGTASTLQDLQSVISMAEYVHGFNSASQGTFRKGNRTLGELEGVQSGADNRSRLIALRMEYAIFTPIKQSIKFNVLQFQPKQDLLSLTSGQPIQIDPAQLRETIMEFKVADGFTPKSKIMSVEAATVAFQTIQAVPMLQQQFDLVGVFTDLMSHMGYPGLEKHKLTPQQQQEQPPVIDPNTGQPVGEPENAGTET